MWIVLHRDRESASAGPARPPAPRAIPGRSRAGCGTAPSTAAWRQSPSARRTRRARRARAKDLAMPDHPGV